MWAEFGKSRASYGNSILLLIYLYVGTYTLVLYHPWPNPFLILFFQVGAIGTIFSLLCAGSFQGRSRTGRGLVLYDVILGVL